MHFKSVTNHPVLILSHIRLQNIFITFKREIFEAAEILVSIVFIHSWSHSGKFTIQLHCFYIQYFSTKKQQKTMSYWPYSNLNRCGIALRLEYLILVIVILSSANTPPCYANKAYFWMFTKLAIFLTQLRWKSDVCVHFRDIVAAVIHQMMEKSIITGHISRHTV